jgi:plasmid stability protein
VKQLTIRGIPDEVERAIRKEAGKKGVSLNKAALAVLERAGGASRRGKRKAKLYHDLDHLCGIWNKKQSDEMEKHAALHRDIDEALWKR